MCESSHTYADANANFNEIANDNPNANPNDNPNPNPNPKANSDDNGDAKFPLFVVIWFAAVAGGSDFKTWKCWGYLFLKTNSTAFCSSKMRILNWHVSVRKVYYCMMERISFNRNF